jgi:hypothetical protein
MKRQRRMHRTSPRHGPGPGIGGLWQRNGYCCSLAVIQLPFDPFARLAFWQSFDLFHRRMLLLESNVTKPTGLDENHKLSGGSFFLRRRHGY